MKYIIVIGDGMSDVKLKKLKNQTPLQVAKHPNMDFMASNGTTGLIQTIPAECNPGTEVAFMSIFGQDIMKNNPSRGPLEAAGMGVNLGKNDLAIRCNLVTVFQGILKDHSAGHITTAEANELIQKIKEHFQESGRVEFHFGVSYRHILVLRGKEFSNMISCTPPHDAINIPIKQILAKPSENEGIATAEILNKMILNSETFLKDHHVNRTRVKARKKPGNMIWFWGQGYRPIIQSLKDSYHIKGAVISAVDIVNGIGRYLGMEIVKVPGATGYYDTNYEGKAKYALRTLRNNDLVLIHIEGPDEASHVGDCDLKVKTIEDIDSRLLRIILNDLQEEYTLIIMADHTTRTSDGAHDRSPVPFACYTNLSQKKNSVRRFDEFSVRNDLSTIIDGKEFMRLFLNQMQPV
jgi:2,3-bisphosphoglycerate-independent phosphoglycerate mutase